MSMVVTFRSFIVAAGLALLMLWSAGHAQAAGHADQSTPPPASPDATPIDGPPAPVPPAVITRDAAHRATVRAIRLTESLRLDGVLDEPVYQSVPPIGDFIQQLPKEGAPATERTEAWVLFDRRNFYVAARCWDSADPSQWVANEFRRDTNQLRNNDTFGVLLDTFYDRRNGVGFYTNPLGALADFAVADESNPNPDWNPIWDVRTGRFEGGWTVELAIPFKSLRYRSGSSQAWGIQLRRVIRRKNEWTFLTLVPASAGGPSGVVGILRVSAAGTVVGLDPPAVSRNFELKPYGISRWITDRRSAGPPDEVTGDVGVDAKYGLTANLTADFTYNTDFAQVEADEQQINLTRFSLFFPEKREFFLESRGTFDFGRPPTPGFGGGNDVPLLFFTRRIGLNNGRVVPIVAGGRLTGKVGRFGLGALNIQTGEEAQSGARPTNFTVLRLKRDLLRRSSIGAIFTNRSDASAGGGANQAYGLDAAFSLRQEMHLSGYAARTQTPGHAGDDANYDVRFDYTDDRYGAQVEHLRVGEHFNPEIGFVRRQGFRRTSALLRFSPRPRSIKAVRRFSWEAGLDYIVDGAGGLESRQQQARFATELENSDRITIEATSQYERIDRAFAVAGVVIAPGRYQFSDVNASYALGTQRRVSGTVGVQRGQFYDGTITAVGFSSGRIELTSHLSLEPGLSINRIALPVGAFTTRLIRARFDYAFTPRMFVSAFPQYNSADRTVSSNFRFRWEYHPGSELFVVYTDERDTSGSGFPSLNNRAFVVKVNRLFRF